MSRDLKPCPFCGGVGKLINPMGVWTPEGYGAVGSRITCTSPAAICCAYSPAFYGPNQNAEAVAAWNTSAALQKPAAEPVAWFVTDYEGESWSVTDDYHRRQCAAQGYKLEPLFKSDGQQPAAISQQLAAALSKFVDFEDRYDADKSVVDDEVREATALAKTLLGPMAAQIDWAGMHALVGQVARMNHESEQEGGMSPDDAVDTLNSMITWARSLVGGKAP